LRLSDEIKGYPISSIVVQRPKIPNDMTITNDRDINLRNLRLKRNDLAKLKLFVNSPVSFKANYNLLLIEHYTNSSDSRKRKLDDTIYAALTTGQPIGHGKRNQ
jgi:hypothetical protein